MDRHHRISAERIAIDQTLVEGSRRCTKCDRAKPLAYFAWLPSTARYQSWCKQCVRIGVGLSYEDPDVRASRHEYTSSPRYRAMKRAWDAARDRREHCRITAEYHRTPRGRIVHRLNDARCRLRKATTDEQRARIQSLIDRHTAALAALDEEDE